MGRTFASEMQYHGARWALRVGTGKHSEQSAAAPEPLPLDIKPQHL